MVRRVLAGGAAGLVVLVAWAWTAFSADMRRAYARIRGQSQVVRTPQGDVEYAAAGAGTPVLVIHGSGGGFDQGALLARAALDTGRVRWIAPSRFGYLRSTFRPGATFDDQAHAYGALLDALNVERVAVVALSHGGPSALLFAVLHPDRVTSLTLISAGVASSTDPAQASASRQGDALTAVFQRDVRYWAMTTLFRGWFLRLMGVTDDVIATLTPAQRALADEVVDGMNPVSPRAAGVRFDNTAAMPDARIAAIRAPTLILHAADDTLQLVRNAEYAAATIPRARFVRFPRGGHLLLAVEQPAIREQIAAHIAAHAGGDARPDG